MTLRALALILAFPALAQEVRLQSTVAAATLYDSAALVVREAPLDLPAGTHTLLIPLPDFGGNMVDGSLRVDGAEIAVRSTAARRARAGEIAAAPARAALEDEIEALEADIRDFDAQIAELEAQIVAGDARISFLRSLSGGDSLAPVEALDGTARLIFAQVEQDLADIATSQAEMAALGRDRDELREKRADAEARLGALGPAPSTILEVEVIAPAATSAPVQIRYLTRNAFWRPTYDLELTEETGAVRIESLAAATQRTGEAWEDIALTLSTAAPSRPVGVRDLPPIQLGIAQDLGRVAMADSLSVAQPAPRAEGGLLSSSGEPAPPIATDRQEGRTLVFDLSDAVDLAHSVPRELVVTETELAADLFVRAVPLIGRSGYLVADIENTSDTPLLPAPATISRDGTFLGEAAMPALAPGASAELGFGPIDTVETTRRVERLDSRVGLIGGANRSAQTVTLTVTNLGTEPAAIRLEDRVPFSETEEVQITWTATPAADVEDADGRRGVLHWTFDLAPGASQTVTLDIDIRWPENERLAETFPFR